MLIDPAQPRRKQFVPFLMTGFPDFEASARAAEALLEAGVRALELGAPYSDPVGDGVAVQRAAERALANGIRLEDALTLASRLKARFGSAEIVLFSYLNPIAKRGFQAYARAASDSGVDATLTVDLPPEEAGAYVDAHARAGVKTVFLASPTTSDARLRLVDEISTGFVYYVSRAGVTGARATLSPTLPAELARLRRVARKPIAVGFGISTPEQAGEVARDADAVVVGSRLLSLLEPGDAAAIDRAQAFAVACMKSMNPPIGRDEGTP